PPTPPSPGRRPSLRSASAGPPPPHPIRPPTWCRSTSSRAPLRSAASRRRRLSPSAPSSPPSSPPPRPLHPPPRPDPPAAPVRQWGHERQRDDGGPPRPPRSRGGGTGRRPRGRVHGHAPPFGVAGGSPGWSSPPG